MGATSTEEERSIEMCGDTILEVNDPRIHYEGGSFLGNNPVKAVDGVSFDIQRGETLGLVGESNCGKSTFGRTLACPEEAVVGEVKLSGTDITTLSDSDLKQFHKDVQTVFQDPDSGLSERMTVDETARGPLGVHDQKVLSECRERVRELLETVGLQEQHYYHYPHQFSGGRRQRINITRVLALEPESTVLNEPMLALDVSMRTKILNLLEDLQNESGLTYPFIAYGLTVVHYICDHVAMMCLGDMAEVGPAGEMFG